MFQRPAGPRRQRNQTQPTTPPLPGGPAGYPHTPDSSSHLQPASSTACASAPGASYSQGYYNEPSREWAAEQAPHPEQEPYRYEGYDGVVACVAMYYNSAVYKGTIPTHLELPFTVDRDAFNAAAVVLIAGAVANVIGAAAHAGRTATLGMRLEMRRVPAFATVILSLTAIHPEFMNVIARARRLAHEIGPDARRIGAR